MRSMLSWLLCFPLALFVPDVAGTGTSQPVRIGGSQWVADAPTKVADALGLFNRDSTGPTIHVDNYNAGKQAVAALLDGKADFALATSTPIARALLDWHLDTEDSTPPPFAILTAISQSNQTHLVIADRADGIEQIADLAGKRIGIVKGTSSHYGWHRFVSFHGLDPTNLTLVDLPVSRHGAAIQSGDINASVSWEPWASEVADDLGDRAKRFNTRPLYAVNGLLVTRHDFLVTHPKLVDRVLQAYQDAMKIIDREPARARSLHARAVPANSHELESLEAGITWSLGLDWAIVADMEAQFRWLTDQRRIPASDAPTPSRYLFAEPLSRIAPRRITLPAYFFADEPRAITDMAP